MSQRPNSWFKTHSPRKTQHRSCSPLHLTCSRPMRLPCLWLIRTTFLFSDPLPSWGPSSCTDTRASWLLPSPPDSRLSDPSPLGPVSLKEPFWFCPSCDSSLLHSLLVKHSLLVRKYACKAGDTGHVGLIPGSGRSSEGGNGNPLQYPCLENPMDWGAWRGLQSVGSQVVRHDWVSTQLGLRPHATSPCPISLNTNTGWPPSSTDSRPSHVANFVLGNPLLSTQTPSDLLYPQTVGLLTWLTLSWKTLSLAFTS